MMMIIEVNIRLTRHVLSVTGTSVMGVSERELNVLINFTSFHTEQTTYVTLLKYYKYTLFIIYT